MGDTEHGVMSLMMPLLAGFIEEVALSSKLMRFWNIFSLSCIILLP